MGPELKPSVEVAGAPPLCNGHCRVIAEAGANHNNSIETALEMARRAADVGAWGVKFQLYKAHELVVKDSPKYWDDEIGTATQYEAFTRSDRLDYDDYAPVAKYCRDRGIVFFATPFDFAAVDALERLGAPVYKIASGDLTNKPLIDAVASTGKPIIISTGAATEDEVREAVEWTKYGPDKLVILVCTLTYPAPDRDGHFARIESFREAFFPYLIGISDHTLGPEGGWVASGLGAVCIEKHYTLDKSLPDVPDHAISLDADELAELVRACDRGAVLRGDRAIAVRDSERPARENARRSIVMAADVPAGTAIAIGDVTMKRPGTGIPPSRLGEIIGRRVRRDLSRDSVLSEGDLEPKR